MNTLHLLLDASLWAAVRREAAARALDADALLGEVLTTRFARWMPPDEPLDAGDPFMRLRLALAACAADDTGRAPTHPEPTIRPDAGAADATLRGIVATLDGATAYAARRRAERLEAWQSVFRAAERAHRRADHHTAIERFAAAAELARGNPAPLVLSLERLARTLLVTGRPTEAGLHARRALALAESRGLPQVEGLAELATITAQIAAAHPAVHQIVAGLLAVEQRDAATADERLVEGAQAASEAGRADYEMRARGALAVVRLAVGAGRAASGEARRAAALARDAALDDLGGLLEVLASAGEQLAPDSRPRAGSDAPPVGHR